MTSEYFGNLFTKDKKKFNIIYKLFIDKTSYLLKSIGVNINTVPVLDLRVKGASNIIGDRSFSKNKKNISKIGDICIDYFHENSIGTVMKHIPGHGLANVDSHKKLPIINKNINYLLKNDFYTFKNKNSLIAMTGHLLFNKIDPEYNVTYSKKINKLIRNYIGFKNLIITDDLSMKALKETLSQRVKMSFIGGCNLVLHCNGNIREMEIVAKNSPKINKFILKKTSQLNEIMR